MGLGQGGQTQSQGRSSEWGELMAPGSKGHLGVGAVTWALPGKGSRGACGMIQKHLGKSL